MAYSEGVQANTSKGVAPQESEQSEETGTVESGQTEKPEGDDKSEESSKDVESSKDLAKSVYGDEGGEGEAGLVNNSPDGGQNPPSGNFGDDGKTEGTGGLVANRGDNGGSGTGGAAQGNGQPVAASEGGND